MDSGILVRKQKGLEPLAMSAEWAYSLGDIVFN